MNIQINYVGITMIISKQQKKILNNSNSLLFLVPILTDKVKKDRLDKIQNFKNFNKYQSKKEYYLKV